MKDEDRSDCDALRFGTETAVKVVLEKFNIDQSLRKYLIGKYGGALSVEDLNDVRQESRAGLWAFVHSGRFREECSLQTLFWRIAARKYVDWLRKQKRYEPLPAKYAQERADEQELDYISGERANALRLAFDQWSITCPGICPELLRAWAEKGEKEISYKKIEAQMRLKEGQARRKVHDCKAHFRNWLKKNPKYFEPLK